MKIIRIESLGCSSCLIMKSRIKSLIEESKIEWISIDSDDAEEVLKKYQIDEEVYPIYIREDNGNVLIGEHNKKDILAFFEGVI